MIWYFVKARQDIGIEICYVITFYIFFWDRDLLSCKNDLKPFNLEGFNFAWLNRTFFPIIFPFLSQVILGGKIILVLYQFLSNKVDNFVD